MTAPLPFHLALLEHPCFVAGETCFGLVETIAQGAKADGRAVVGPGPTRVREEVVGVELDGRRGFMRAADRASPPA